MRLLVVVVLGVGMAGDRCRVCESSGWIVKKRALVVVLVLTRRIILHDMLLAYMGGDLSRNFLFFSRIVPVAYNAAAAVFIDCVCKINILDRLLLFFLVVPIFSILLMSCVF